MIIRHNVYTATEIEFCFECREMKMHGYSFLDADNNISFFICDDCLKEARKEKVIQKFPPPSKPYKESGIYPKWISTTIHQWTKLKQGVK